MLDLIAHRRAGAHTAGRPIGVCGEAAGDPLLALVLVGLGVTSLSMAPPKVPAVRYALSRHDLATCVQMAQVAREAVSPQAARAAVARLADPAVVRLADPALVEPL